jgi:DNA polymerase III subunit delta
MIVKYFDLKKKVSDKINFYLLYGQNSGLIDETINVLLKPIFPKNIFNYDEIEVLSKSDEFKEKIFNKSFFENDKLIIINRASDKILNLVEEIIDSKIENTKIIIRTGLLEKKSKLRGLFEKNKNTIVVPFYDDNHQSLVKIANDFFGIKKIKISPQNVNFIVERSKGNRVNLKNELEKISNFSHKKQKIELSEIIKLTNLAENYNVSELADQCLAKNKNKTLKIINENNPSSDDNIIILKTFLYKLKRLKKLKINLDISKNPDAVISSFKPPIFWKDKDLVKLQLKVWSLSQIKSLIKKVNDAELSIKKNSQIANEVVNDFILNRLKQSNN